MATKKVQPTGKRKKSKKAQKNNKRIILFVVEMIVLVILLAVLYMVLKADKVNKVSIDKEDWAITQNTHQPLISEDIFARAQINLGKNTKK